MNVIKDFDFVYESEHYIKERLGIEKRNIEFVCDAITATINWWKKSSYKYLTKYVDVYLTDMPLSNDVAFVGANAGYERLLIYINIISLVVDYESGEYKDDFQFKTDLSCYDFAKFVLLHEIGHIVISNLEVGYKGNVVDKFEAYMTLYESDYKKLKESFNEVSSKAMSKNKKRYRNILSERKADKFALLYEKDVE